MDKKKSPLNKTIDFSAEEGKIWLERCLTDSAPLDTADKITDKTINGDSFKVISQLPAGFADLIIADPPYNLQKTYSSTKFKAQSSKDYIQYTKDWLENSLRLLKETGSMYICCDWKSSILISFVLTELEEKNQIFIRNRITWEREKGRGAKSNWKNCHEDIWFITKSDSYTFNMEAVKMRRKVIAPYKVDGKPKDWNQSDDGNYRDTCPSNFWNDISIPFWSMPENTAHPTQKSEKLLAKLILASSNKGDMVFDPFSGSGSTLVTAKKLDRHWCGIEREENYCAWTEYRLEKAGQDKTIQGFEDGIFKQRNE